MNYHFGTKWQQYCLFPRCVEWVRPQTLPPAYQQTTADDLGNWRSRCIACLPHRLAAESQRTRTVIPNQHINAFIRVNNLTWILGYYKTTTYRVSHGNFHVPVRFFRRPGMGSHIVVPNSVSFIYYFFFFFFTKIKAIGQFTGV